LRFTKASHQIEWLTTNFSFPTFLANRDAHDLEYSHAKKSFPLVLPMILRITATICFLLGTGLHCHHVTANEASHGTAKTGKANFLFIFADDLAYDCVGFAGNEVVETPNLDRLAQRSTHFTHAYNMGSWSGAVCVASRTMLNTGQFVWRAEKMVAELNRRLIPQGQLWSQRMKAAGYETFLTGKWHVKADTGKIFDHVRHVRPGMPAQVPEGYNRPQNEDDTTWLPWDTKNGGFWEGGQHWSEVVADDATEYLDIAAANDAPFFMYIAFNAPHDPRQSPKEFVEKYPLDGIRIPEPFFPEYPYALGMNRIRDEKLAPFPRTPYSVKVNRQEYYAIITHLDREIGRILDHLQKSGQAENTYIVFTADHGLACGHHSLMGKQNMYDHSLRVPFLISGPNVSEGKQISSPIYLQDAMPTALEIANAPLQDIEFKSLLPLIENPSKQHYDSIYGGYLKSQRSITKDGFKLIVYPKIREMLLFDLNTDPQETNNISQQSEHQPRIQALLAELKHVQHQMDDQVAIDQEALAASVQLEPIFNGRDLTGWRHNGNWQVQDGVITRTGKGGSLVYTESKVPDDFELRFDWKVAPGSNSGVYYRPTQYEYQILDNGKHADGKNPRTSAASLYFCMPPSRDATRRPGHWNSGRIVCQGSVIQHWLNGEKVVDFDYTDPQFEFEVDLLKKRGGDLTARGAFLTLQDHGDPVWYRNLRWRNIDPSEDIGHATIVPDKLKPEVLKTEAKKIKQILKNRK
jgi:arylsulfatase A-like enzyme